MLGYFIHLRVWVKKEIVNLFFKGFFFFFYYKQFWCNAGYPLDIQCKICVLNQNQLRTTDTNNTFNNYSTNIFRKNNCSSLCSLPRIMTLYSVSPPGKVNWQELMERHWVDFLSSFLCKWWELQSLMLSIYLGFVLHRILSFCFIFLLDTPVQNPHD